VGSFDVEIGTPLTMTHGAVDCSASYLTGEREGEHPAARRDTERREIMPGANDLRFSFDELRTVQACALLIESAEGRENYTKLLKILYLADRKSLVETGRTITGDTFVSMAKGPVLSEVYDRVKAKRTHPVWDRYIVKDGFDVKLVLSPGGGELSDYDVDGLTSLAAKHRGDSWCRMIDIVHELKEWRDPTPQKMAPLSPSDILRAEGVDESVIADLARQNEYFAEVGKLLAS